MTNDWIDFNLFTEEERLAYRRERGLDKPVIRKDRGYKAFWDQFVSEVAILPVWKNPE